MTEENENRYDALWERNKEQLVHNVMELEDICEATETYMQEEAARMEKLEAENKAMKQEITEWYTVKKGLPPKDMMRDLDYFFDFHKDDTKEELIIEAYKYMMALYELRNRIG
jgi:chromatin segregation and condensation protein Rec8/ScpA/Scc1 (kleisin family)